MKRLKNPAITWLAALAALGCSDTLRAQNVLTVTPSSLTFNNALDGTTSPAQPVNISWNQPSTGTAVVQANQSWILLNGMPTLTSVNFSNTPAVLNVSVNPQNLAAGNYSGTVTVSTGNGSAALSQTVSVSMTVTGTSLLSALPASLSFTATQGSNTGTPSSAPVTISSSGQALSFTLSVQTQTAGWLLLSNSCLSSAPCTTGSTFSVSVNPSGLTAGTYTGSITAQSTTTSDAVSIPVTLTVNPNATLSVSPATPPPFLWQIGTPNPAPQQLSVTTTDGSTANFTVTVSQSAPWLVVSPLSGSTPGTVLLNANPAGAALTAGAYNTTVVIASGANSVSVPVQLIVAAHPLIQLSNTSLTFAGQFAATTPPATQTVQVMASGNSAQGFQFSVSTVGATWLTASTTGTNFSSSGSGTTPATLTVQVNPVNLQVGTYMANISVTPTNGDNYTETVAVTFSVTAGSVLEAGPQNLLFSYQMGQVPPGAQSIFVTTTGQPLPFTVSVPPIPATTNCPANWLTATSSSTNTPANVSISASVAGMTAGLCQGAFNLVPQTGSPVIIGVTVAISPANQPALTVSMPAGFGLATAEVGAASGVCSIATSSGCFIALTSTSPTATADFTVLATSAPSGWLSISPNVGSTPTNLSVAINPGVAGLTTPGIYNGSITISSTTIPSYVLAVPVTLNLTSNVTVAVSPTSLSFTEAQGGSVPASQNLTLTSTNGTANFTSSIQYANGSNWLQISPESGSATGAVQVKIQPNTLSQGTYNANIILSLVGAASNSITIPVTLTVGPPQTVSVSQTSLSFAYTITSAAPASQKITVTSTGGPVAFTVGSTTTGTGWLSTDITKGTTPMDVNVSVNPQGLAAGTYQGSVSISAPTVLSAPITVPVQLVVSPAPVPQPTTVTNGASFVATYIAPGELISIFGSNLGPSTAASFKLNSSGGVDNTLAGVQVLFNGNPGTPLYVSPTQINVIVPWEINGQTTASVVVSFNSIQSAPLNLSVTPQSPGLFTINAQGTGQVAAFNQNGAPNGASGQGYAPAPQGSVIAVLGTGGGQTTPPGTTGSVTPIPQNANGLLKIPGTITATIGGQPATVEFAGEAPGLVTGVFQINIQVPTGVSGSNLPLTVTINGATTNNISATVAVQ